MLLIHGKAKFYIRHFEPLFYKCPYCDADSSTEVFIYSWYYHFFWIPVYPFKKEAIAKCTECGVKRPDERFGPKLTEHLREELGYSKHPLYAWTLLLVVCALIVLIIIIRLSRSS